MEIIISFFGVILTLFVIWQLARTADNTAKVSCTFNSGRNREQKI